MRKQTKLVAVLSAAALLALGASMTSFAATGWQEENGTWVYYNKSGNKATETWAKSGDNWFYLNSDGELATEQLVDDDNDNYYYVDANGAMVKNAWVAIENTDAGDDNEPDQWWYYFGANGKAYKGSSNDTTINLKTINGKKYAFNSEAQMLYGWIADKDTTIINDDTDAWQNGVYYFGSSDDGAMTTGWLLLDIEDESAEQNNEYRAPGFKDDEDQSRWFYFKSNGKKYMADTASSKLKEKTINGAKYGFDEYGRMVAEWSLGTTNTGSASVASSWKYFSDVESGARVTKGWFKVVPAQAFDGGTDGNGGKYGDDEEGWYYADNNGNLLEGEFKNIKGKKYAFRPSTGAMESGLKFFKIGASSNDIDARVASDTYSGLGNFETEDDFLDSAPYLSSLGYYAFYMGDGDDGAIRTGMANVSIDGDNFSFNLNKSGGKKGAGVTKVDDKKFYTSGMLIKAGKDEKYQAVVPVIYDNGDEVELDDAKFTTRGKITGYKKLDDDEKLKGYVTDLSGYAVYTLNDLAYTIDANDKTVLDTTDAFTKAVLDKTKMTEKKILDGKYANVQFYVKTTTAAGGEVFDSLGLATGEKGTSRYGVSVINTSGKITTSTARVKDGNDVYYDMKSGVLTATYTED